MEVCLKRSTTNASGLWTPSKARPKVMYQEECGAGATRDGVPIVREQSSFTAGDLRGSVVSTFLDTPIADRVDMNHHRFASVSPGTGSAGTDYPMLIEGDPDFVLF